MDTKSQQETTQHVNKNGDSDSPPKKRRGITLRTAFDVRRLLNRVINELRREEVTPDIARCQAYLCQIILKSIEQGELEDRIKKLEIKIKEA